MSITMEKPGLDLVGMYPDLFEGLDPEYVEGLTSDWGSQWLEGWVPNRGAVADSIAVHLGTMTPEEAGQRAVERGRARRAGLSYPGDE